MKFWVSRFQKGLWRAPNDVRTLWWALAPRRSDDASGPGDLDRVWRAECDEMNAILKRREPRQIRNDRWGSSDFWNVRTTRGMLL